MSIILDYSIKDVEERVKIVEDIVDENTYPAYLETLANYILFADKKQDSVLTDNRMVTVNKRETSLDSIFESYEKNKDQVYSLFTEDKNIIFKPQNSITPRDLEEIPDLQQTREAIGILSDKQLTAVGKDKFIIKNAIIELRKDQYIIKEAYRKPMSFSTSFNGAVARALNGEEHLNEDGTVSCSGVSLCNPSIVSLLLCNYSALKEEAYGDFRSDLWFLMEDLDNLVEIALEHEPKLKKILICKIDGKQNSYIREELELEFGLTYTPEYISNLWRHKIPKLIADAAVKQWLEWQAIYNPKTKWKTCSKCGETKLASNLFFSKNKSSKDGLYSICKKCRSTKKKAGDSKR